MRSRQTRQLRRAAEQFGTISINAGHPNVLEFRPGTVREVLARTPGIVIAGGLIMLASAAVFLTGAALPDAYEVIKRGLFVLGGVVLYVAFIRFTTGPKQKVDDRSVHSFPVGRDVAVTLRDAADHLDITVRNTPGGLVGQVLPIVATMRADLLTIAAAAAKPDPSTEQLAVKLRSNAQQLAGRLAKPRIGMSGPKLVTDDIELAGLLETLDFIQDNTGSST